MSTPPPADEVAARIRIMQIILGALLLGVLAFLVIATVARAQSDQPPTDPPVVTWLMLGIGLVLAVAYHFVADAVAAGQRRAIAGRTADARGAWYGAYQTTLLASAVLLEGAAFLQLVAYLIEGNWLSRLAAVGFLGFMATLFPTRPGVERWIAEQQDLLARERSVRQ